MNRARPSLARRWSLPACALACVLALFAPAASALAQTNYPPSISFSPSGGTYGAGSSTSLTVTACDYDSGASAGIYGGSLYVTMNGSLVGMGNMPSTSTPGCTSATGTLTFPSTPGTYTLHAQVQDNAGNLGQHDATFTVQSAHASPTVSAAPHNSGFRDVTQGAANVSYTTPAYFSVDQARSATFLFSSGQAQPKGFVQLDVSDPSSATIPSKYSLKLLTIDTHAPVTFTTGTTELYFTASTRSPVRVAGQFDASGYASRAWSFDAVVTSYWSDGSPPQSTTVRVRIPIVNERSSHFGVGWSMPALQTLYDQGDGVFITGGDGTGTWFAKNAAGSYDSPAGDFTRVAWTAGSGGTRTGADGSIVHFDAAGRQDYAQDRIGNRTTYVYDGSGRLSRITDPAGKSITFGYTTAGVLAWVQDAGGRRVNTSTSGTILFQFIAPDGVPELDLDFAGDLLNGYWTRSSLRSTGTTGRWSFTYDFAGQLASMSAPQVSTTDAGSVKPSTHYTSLAAAVLPQGGAGTSTNPRALLLSTNVRTSVTDPRGNTTYLALDAFGQPTRIEAPLGQTTIITRNSAGQPTQVADPLGTTTYTWSGANLTDVSRPAASLHVQTTYTSAGGATNLPLQVTNGSVVTTYRYGSHGEVTTAKTGQDSLTYQYTGSGAYYSPLRLYRATDSKGHTAEYAYDGTTGNVQTLGGTGMAWSERTFDAYGRTVKVKDADNDSTRIVYDALNRVTSTTDGQGHTTSQNYATVLQPKVTDAVGKTFGSTYNALGWLTGTTDPNQRLTAAGYDRAGNRTRVTNRRGQVIQFTYDALNRVSTRVADGQTTTYGYASDGSWISISNPESTDTLYLDAAGRTREQHTRMAGQLYKLVSGYRAEGDLTSLQVTYPGGATSSVSYGYTAEKLTSITGLNGQTTSLTYNPDGQVSAITLAGSLQESFSYTDHHAPSQIRWWPTSVDDTLGMLLDYDGSDRLKYRMNVFQTLRRDFEYDHAGQLTVAQDMDGETLPGCSSVCDWEPAAQGYLYDFYYDAVGNRTDAGATLEPSSNRYSYYRGMSFTYDADGNTLTRSGSAAEQYQWDSLGQLTGVYVNGGWVHYGYNGFGQRVRKTDPNGTVTRYLYDGDDLIAEVDGSGNRLREYAYYPGVDNPHSVRINGGSVYYYSVDVSGNVTGLVDASGNVVNRYRYGPYGESEAKVEGVSNPLQFAGRELDAGTGLYYLRARWYDPLTGRFLSEDPIGLAGGINWYTYASNSPTNFRDPSGLDDCSKVKADWPYAVTVCGSGSGSGPRDPGNYGPDLPSTPPVNGYPTGDPPGLGGGGGGGGRHERPDAPLPKSCTDALKTAGASPKAVSRAESSWDVLSSASAAHNIDPRFLGAIGIRESGFQNVAERDGAGVGVGVFQLTVAAGSGVTAAEASNLSWAANYAATMLQRNMGVLSHWYPTFSSAQLLQATAASYNMGLSRKNISGNPNTIDVGTTGNNYGSTVVSG